MVKRLSIILAIILLSAGSERVFGQETQAGNTPQQAPKIYTIKGLATDTAGKAVEYATYALRRGMMDFDGVKRGVTDASGRFEFVYQNQPDTMLLTISKEGMTSTDVQVVLAESQVVDLGSIKLQAGEELKAVAVVAYRPLVTQELDRIKYDIESDPESKSNSTLEMLRKVPMVTIDHEENIKVKGSSSFKVYINGKPSNIVSQNPKDVLKSMPASNIKRIEVITDPGAKYDAEGVQAIINIVTQSALQGFQGNISARYDIATGSLGASAYLAAKIGKFGVTTNYHYNLGYSEMLTETLTTYSNEAMPYKYHGEEKYQSMTKYNGHYGNLELSYEIDSMNLISGSVGLWGYGSNSKPYTSNLFMKDKDQNIVGRYQNFLDLQKNSIFSINGNIDYQHTFQKPGQLLTLSYLISTQPTRNESQFRILNDAALPAIGVVDKDRRTTSKAHGTEHTAQIDYVEPFAGGKHTMEIGVKYIFRSNISNNTYMLFNPATQGYDLKDPDQKEQDMKYYQQVFGAYGSYTFRLQKFSARVGARLEGNIQDVHFIDSEQEGFKAKYVDLIPSVSLSYMVSPGMNLSLSYNNSISRPSIFYLNPYVERVSDKVISYGNPNLKSERSHNLSLSYGFFSQKVNLNLSLDGGLVNNAITQDHFVADDGIYHATYNNIGKNYSTGLNAFISYNPTQWLSMWFSGGPRYNYYRNLDYSIGSLQSNLFAGMNFVMPWKLKLSLGGGGMTPYKGYKMSFSGYYYYYASLGRSFLKNDQLNVNVSVVNPHAKYMSYQMSTFDDTFEFKNNMQHRARQITLNVSWRFGEMKAKIAKAERGIENTDLKEGDKKGGSQGGGGIGM